MSTATAIDIENVRINGERLWASLMELAKIGATPKGGVHPGAGRLGARAAQQRVHGFIQQDGGVLQIRGHHGP